MVGVAGGFKGTVGVAGRAWLAAGSPSCCASWRSVQAIVIRVVAELAGRRDRLDGLRRIGCDEIALGHWYLLVAVDHDAGRLV